MKRAASVSRRVPMTLTITLLLTSLSGCAAPMARSMCAKSGLVVGSPEHSACTANLRAQWKAEARSDLAGAVGLGAAIAGATSQAPPYQAPAVATTASHETLRREWINPEGRMCLYANGTTLNVGTRSCPASIASSR